MKFHKKLKGFTKINIALLVITFVSLSLSLVLLYKQNVFNKTPPPPIIKTEIPKPQTNTHINSNSTIENITSKDSPKPLSTLQTTMRKEEIKIGTVLDLTGSTSETHLKILEGLKLRINQANNLNELGNRKIILTALDHEYDRQKATEKLSELVNKYQTEILICPAGTETINACLPIMQEKKLLVFGAISRPTKSYTDINISFLAPSFCDEASKLVEYALKKLSLKKIALFYQNDGYGTTILESVKKILKTANYPDENILCTGYSPNTTNVSETVQKISEFSPDGLFLFSLLPPANALLSKISNVKSLKYFFGSSPLNNSAFTKLFNEKGYKFIRSHLIPSIKNGNTNLLDITKNYIDALRESNLEPDDLSFECFIAADIFIDLLKKIDGPITKEKIQQKIEALNNYNLKGLYLNYDPQKKQLLNNIWVETETGEWLNTSNPNWTS